MPTVLATLSLRQLSRVRLLRIPGTWHRRRHFGRPAARADGGEEAGPPGYLTLVQQHSAELEVKKSKFLTTAWPVGNAEEALQCIDSRRDPTATHNCWAYKIGQQYRSFDDGEPGGTAGRPILAAIEGEGLDGVCVLVIRYYGGIKLGAGGLVRAYGGAARECLKAAPKKHVAPKVTLVLQAPFELIGPIYPLLDQYAAEKLREDYSDDGTVTMELRVEENAAHRLQSAVQDATSGRVIPSIASR